MPSEAIIFQNIVTIANQAAFELTKARDTCILTSYALHNVLQRLGYNSRPIRIEAGVFPNDRKLSGTVLGSFTEPSRRRAAKPGMWHGHLAVAVDNKWLLDPTLDQANKENWPEETRVGPLAIETPETFWAGKSLSIEKNNCFIRFDLNPKQKGFTYAGDARPSHWRDIANLTFDNYTKLQNAPIA